MSLSDSPAEEAGIKPRDILLSINDRRVESNAQLMTALRQLPPDSEVAIRLKRDGEYKLVKAKMITEENALLRATNPDALKMNFRGIFLDESRRILASA